MATKRIEVGEIQSPAPKGDRQVRWEKYVAAYAVSNPVKHAAKEKNGEFATIPASFK